MVEITEMKVNEIPDTADLDGGVLCGIGTCGGIVCGAGCPVSGGSACGWGCTA